MVLSQLCLMRLTNLLIDECTDGIRRHWAVINITGDDVASGEVASPYKGPSPRTGTGNISFFLMGHGDLEPADDHP